MADFRISLGVDIDTSDIRSQINNIRPAPIDLDVQINTRNLQSQINNIRTTPVDINVNLNDTDALRRVDNIRQQLQALANIRINLGGGNGGRGGRRQVDETTQAYRELMGVLNELNSKRLKLNGLDASSPQSSNQIQRLRLQIEQLENEYNNLMNSFNTQGIRFSADQWNELETAIAKVGRQIDVVQAGMSDKSVIKQQTQAYKELLSVSKEISSLEFNIVKLRGQGGNNNQIAVLENQLRTLQATYQQLVTSMETPLNADQWSSIYTQIAQTSERIAQLQAQIADTRADMASGIRGNFSGYEAQIESLVERFGRLSNESVEVQTGITNIRQALADMRNAANDNDLIEAEERYQAALKETEAQLRRNISVEKQANNIDNLALDKEKAMLRLNGLFEDGSQAAKKFGSEVRRLQNELNECGNITGVQKVNKQISNLEKQVKNSGLQTETFGSKIKKQFARYKDYLSVATVLMWATQGLKDMFNQVVAIDTAMTELRKVTDETDASYDKFLSNAASRAKEIGTTIDGLVGSTADFARLGYGFEESQGLAEVANIYAVVGDEIEGVEGATQSLVSTLAAFKDEASGISDTDFAMDIVDKFNEVSNNFSISSGGIGEALTRSASSLAAANNTLDESIALITAANEVTQNPEKVGNAMKTISMRIRGAKSELEEAGESTDGMVESTAKLREEIMALSGVDIMLNENTFKSTYAIMDELAAKWEDLSDIAQATIIELIAGKHQGNVFSSLMANFQTARDALDTSLNSSGSAMAEHAKWSESLEARLLKLKATWQSLSQSFMSSNFLKAGISVITGFVDIIDGLISKIGTLPTLIGTFAGWKSISKIFNTAKMMNFAGGISSVGDVLSILGAAFPNVSKGISIFTAALKGGVGMMGIFKTAASGLWTVIAAHPILATVAAIGLAIAAFIKWGNAAEDLAEKVGEATSKYKEQHNELIKNKSSFESLAKRYAELSKGVGSQGENISLTTDEYLEYQNVVNSIAEQIPSLVSGYDSQGNAILNCAGNVNELTAAYEKLIKAQNDEILKAGEDGIGAKDIEKDFKNKMKKFDGESSGKNEIAYDSIKRLEEALNGKYSKDKIEELFDDSASVVDIVDALQEEGLANDVHWYSGYDAYWNAIEDAIAKEPEKVRGIINDFKADVESSSEEIRTIAQAALSNAFDISDSEYAGMSEKMQNIAYQVVNSFDAEKYQNILDSGETVEGYVNSILDDFLKLEESGESKKLEAAFDLKTQFNGGEISYGKYVENIREVGELIDGLNVDSDIKSQLKLALNTDEITKEYDALVKRLTSKEIGFSEATAKNFLNSLSAEEFSVAMDIIPKLDAGATIDDIQAMIKERLAEEFKFDITVQTEGIEALNTALSEARSATGLTTESIEALIGRYEDLDGFNAAALFENTALGVRLNNEELAKLEAQYETVNKLNIDKNLSTLVTKYKELTEQIKTCTDAQKKEELQASADAYADKIKELQTLASQYDGLTSAFNKWQAALSSSNNGDNYDSVYDNLEAMKELREKGLVGVDDFKTFVQLMTNEDLTNADTDKILSVYKKGYPMMQKYFTESDEGCKTFLKDISKINSEWAHLNKDGNWEISFNAQEVADELGVSVDLIHLIADKLKAFGFKIEIDDTSLENLQTEVEKSEAKLKEFGRTPHKANLDVEANSENLGLIETEIDSIVAHINEVNSDSSISPEVKTAELEHARAQLEVLIQKKQEASQPAFMTLNTSQVNASLVDALEKVQAYQTALNELNKLNELKEAGITIDDSELTTAKQNAEDCVKAIQGLDGDVKVAIGLEEDGSLDSIKKAFEEGKVHIDVDTDPVVTKVEQLAENMDRIEDKDITINVTVNGLDDVKELNTNIDLATNIDGDIDSLSEFVENAKELKELGGNITTYVSANIKGNVIETPEYKINNLKTFSESADGLKNVGSVVSNVTANIDGNVKDTAEFSINNLKVFSDNAKDLESIGNVASNVTANIEGNVKDTPEYMINNLKEFSDSAKDLESIGNVTSNVTANIEGNVQNLFEGQIDNLAIYSESAKDVESIGNVSSKVEANIEGNVTGMLETSINNLKAYSDSAKDISTIGNVSSRVEASITGNVTGMLEASIDNLVAYSESAKNVESIGNVESSVNANITGNVTGMLESSIDNLAVYSDSAKDVEGVGNVTSSIEANITGNVTGMLETSIDNLAIYSDSAKNVKDIGNVSSKVEANIEGNVTGMLETSINNLKAYSDNAKDVESIGKVSSSVTADINGNVIDTPEGFINNLKVFTDSAKDIGNIGEDTKAKITADVDGNVINTPEYMINNLSTFTESAKDIKSIGEDTKAKITADIEGNVIDTLESSIDNLKVFVDSAKDIGDIGEDVKVKITANIDGNVINTSESSINSLKVFSDNAKDIKSIGEDTKAKITADIEGNVKDTPEYMINNLHAFVDNAKDLESIGEDVKAKITANIDGNVKDTPEFAINNLKTFIDSAKDIESVGEDVKAKITANIDGNVISTFEWSINNLKVFADSAKDISSIGEDVKAKVTADINGNVKDTSEDKIDNLGVFADNAKKAKDVGNFSSSVTASVNGNIITDDTAVTDLEHFVSIVSGLPESQSANIDVKADVDTETIKNATELLTDVTTSGLFKDYNASVTVDAQTNGLEDVKSLKNFIKELRDKTVNIFIKGAETALTVIGQIKEALKGLVDKEINVSVNKPPNLTLGSQEQPSDKSAKVNYTLGTQEEPVDLMATVDYSLGSQGAPEDKDATVNYVKGSQEAPANMTATVTYKAKGRPGAIGTAHANGTTGRAFVRGDWGIKGNGVALGGELGQELIVRDGKFFTIGDKSAEFFHYKQNDIIFNAAQTESLFKYGGIKGAKPRGRILASGSAFANGTSGRSFAFAKDDDVYANGRFASVQSDSSNNSDVNGSGGFHSESSSSSSSSGSGGGDSGGGSGGGSGDEGKNEVYDWFERLLEIFERAIDSLDSAANNIYKTFGKRNTSLSEEMAKVSEQISNQQAAYERYIAEAESVGSDIDYDIGDDIKEKLRNGDFSIDVTGDEKLAEYISYYKEWYDKALACEEAIQDLEQTLSSLYAQRVENVVTKYEGILSVVEHEKNMLEEYINQAEAQAWLVSSEYYDALANNERETIAELKNQKTEMLAAFNEAMDSGTIDEYSESWYDMVASIDEVTLAIQESETALKEYEQTLQQLSWEIFDLLQDKISSVTDETEFLVELLSSDKLHDDNGKLTNEGKSTMGLHGVAYNAYMHQADLAAEEIAKLKKELESDPFDTELEERYREMVALQQEYILSAQSEKEAIRDLVEEGINLEIEALEERIDKYEEALESQKDLFDYQKKVSEQTSEIASLQKQMAAYENDDSEEAKAKIQELRVSLEEAEADLEETQYDKYISDQSALLDELSLEYSELLNMRLDNVDALMEQMIAEINADSSIIGDTIRETVDSVGYTLSDSMSTIWTESANGTNAVITTYGDKFLLAQTTTNNALTAINTNLQSMINQLNKKATANVKSASKSSVAKSTTTKKDTTAKKTTTTKKSGGGDGVPKIGDKVKYVSGQYYYDSQGKKPLGTHKQGEYVYITNINKKDWATHGYHISTGSKLGKGDLGWLKLNQISGYAVGKKDFLNNEIAWTQEDGKEFIVRPSDGAILTPIARGDSVLTSAASNNIWDMANNPAEFIKDNLNFGTATVPNNSNVQSNYTQHFDKVVFNLPNVKNYEELLSAMQKDKNFERLIDSMTVDRLAGKSSLGKGKSIR